MMYINEQDTPIQIPPDFKQTFENKFNLNIGKNEIIKMKNNNVITDRDIKIANFLFKFKFATADQIYKLLGEDKTKVNLKNRLDKLVKYRVLNKFMLSDFEEEHIVPDSLQIYCLDLGGRYLLAHYSNQDTTDWYSTVNMKTSEIISKNLVATEFYLRIKESVPEKLLYFNVEPEFRVGKKNVIPSFEMGLKINEQNRYFVGEVVREYDFPIQFREKAFKLESLLLTNAWKKYYYDAQQAPVLLLFADTDLTALEAGKLISETTEMENFRLSTDERIQHTLHETGAFLKYIKEELMLKEIKTLTFKP